MIEIKLSGRGGQGAVLASQILATAFFEKEWRVQAFPSFGAERRGAPVSAFLRIDTQEITLRCGILNPDWIVLFDPNLLESPAVIQGLTEKTAMIINGCPRPGDFTHLPFARVFAVDATRIAEEGNLKTTSFSIVNTAMAGAFAGASGLIDVETLAKAVRALVPVKKDENAAAARIAFDQVEELAHA